MKRDSFVFYSSFAQAASTLGDKARLKLYDSVVKLGLCCAENETELDQVCAEIESSLVQNKNVFAQFLLIKPQIISNFKKFVNGSKGKKYGALGGAPKGNKNASKNNPKTTPNVNDNVNDNVNEITKEKPLTGSKEIPPLENSLSPGAPAPEKINTLEKFENWVWQKDKTFCKWQDDKFIPAIQYLKKSLVENEEYYNRLKDEAVSYCQSSGRKYSDYVAFFRNWIWRDSKERGLLA